MPSSSRRIIAAQVNRDPAVGHRIAAVGGVIHAAVLWPLPWRMRPYDTLVAPEVVALSGLRRGLLARPSMCHNVHMKSITIRELHLATGRWVRHAAARGPVAVTDRGRRVAALQPLDPAAARRPLPDREAAIRKRSRISVDSSTYVSQDRGER
jgi:antitoxin (DNA-binding transcriptional repressor) of toxin-antitoxin stability system